MFETVLYIERRRGRQLASLVRAGGRAKNQQQTIFDVVVADTPHGPLSLQLYAVVCTEMEWKRG